MKKILYLFILPAALSCSQSYDYSFTEGAATPEEVFEVVVESVKTNDADLMGTVILNYDMEAQKQLETTRAELEKAKESGDAEMAANYEKAVEMFSSKEYFERLAQMQEKFSEKAAKELEDTKKMFEKYTDLNSLNVSSVYVKDGVRDPDKEKFAGINFFNKDSVEYTIRINTEKIKNRWYYNGQKSAGMR